MAILIPRSPSYWLRQPTSPQELDWGHELAAEAKAVFFFALGSEDLVYGLDNIGVGPTLSSDGASFNGTDQSIDIGGDTGDLGTGSFTVLMRANIPETTDKRVLAKGRSTGHGKRYEITFVNPTKATFTIDDNSIKSVAEYNPAPYVDEYYDYVFCRDYGNTLKVFIDGDQKGSVSDGTGNISASDNFRISNTTQDYSDSFMSVDMAHLIMVNRLLSDAEISELSLNPYQILKRRKTYFLFPESGVAPSTTWANDEYYKTLLSGNSL